MGEIESPRGRGEEVSKSKGGEGWGYAEGGMEGKVWGKGSQVAGGVVQHAAMQYTVKR